ncbi:phosphate binding protein [Desulfofarcimen acetoxidans DSM 771]|uniref:Phosphate-binding protein n=1 Tax=Desulfofarcimen acetoxidans (strain ATCC 49208 / DSM 771 / KCTC 5769 / VKM B-1644 / 5575) TaxID=485916 RepID=C8W2T5_DESAS|nr:phosphate ABC transporter substrate-binding protein [Desulfofarcimen acetoxidans]ACV61091.1 phosphate binding protein [Desulfofarcimen acetoxidans DSM 771]
MKKRSFLSIISLLLGLFLLAGCSQNQQAQTEQIKDTEGQAYSIKIGGSSTLSPVIAKCADNFTEKYKTWNKIDPKLPEEAITIFVSSGGSGFGVKSTINGTVDIGLASREITNSEKEKMAKGNIFKMGSDALTIAVNPQNPVLKVKPNLTADEIKRIFSGEIKTWKQLDPGLSDTPIVIAVRDLGGGASQVFDELVMKGTPVAKEALQLPSMGALAGKVMENANAIGYVSVGLVTQNQNKLAVLKVDGIEPTVENIALGKYKIARPLLLLTKDKPDARQQLFIDYLLSADGLKIVEDMGFIPPASRQ